MLAKCRVMLRLFPFALVVDVPATSSRINYSGTFVDGRLATLADVEKAR